MQGRKEIIGCWENRPIVSAMVLKITHPLWHPVWHTTEAPYRAVLCLFMKTKLQWSVLGVKHAKPPNNRTSWNSAINTQHEHKWGLPRRVTNTLFFSPILQGCFPYAPEDAGTKQVNEPFGVCTSHTGVVLVFLDQAKPSSYFTALLCLLASVRTVQNLGFGTRHLTLLWAHLSCHLSRIRERELTSIQFHACILTLCKSGSRV